MIKKRISIDFPGGKEVVNNSLANPGDMGSIFGSGSFHTQWGN